MLANEVNGAWLNTWQRKKKPKEALFKVKEKRRRSGWEN